MNHITCGVKNISEQEKKDLLARSFEGGLDYVDPRLDCGECGEVGHVITDMDMNNLRHMLGIGSHTKKRQWGYRNHFAPGGADIQSMERLETAGLVCKGRPYADTYFYHATEAGCVAAGLKPYQTRKAMVP